MANRYKSSVYERSNWWTETHGGAPRWLLVVSVALLVLFGGAIYYGVSAGVTPSIAAPTPRPTPPADAVPPTVVFIGDDNIGSGTVDGAVSAWPTLLGDELDVTPMVLGLDGAGYVTVGNAGAALPALTSEVPADTSVVVLLAGRADSAGYDAVRAAAAAFDSALLERAPDAHVIVIGPPSKDDSITPETIATRDALRDAALGAGERVVFVDALDEAWLRDSQDQGLIGSDGVSLSGAGNAYMAVKIEPLVAEALAESASVGNPTESASVG